jgi:hypothetical protein
MIDSFVVGAPNYLFGVIALVGFAVLRHSSFSRRPLDLITLTRQ